MYMHLKKINWQALPPYIGNSQQGHMLEKETLLPLESLQPEGT